MKGWGYTRWGSWAHWFTNGRSLCGRKRWLVQVTLEEPRDAEKCRICEKGLRKREEEAEEET